MASGASESAEEREAALSPPRDRDLSPSTEVDLVQKNDAEHDLSEADKEAVGTHSEDTHQTEAVVRSQKDTNWVEDHNAVNERSSSNETTDAPPLPEEAIPPLPAEKPPTATEEDDGWAPIWEESAQAFYFYNRFTGATQWTNPRVPEASQPGPPGVTPIAAAYSPPVPAPTGTPPTSGYNPAIHGDYDPTAWYAQPIAPPEPPPGPPVDPATQYSATAQFNRFTGRFQNPDLNPENFNDENKSRRQMNAFFDVDAAANSHDGRSLKAERSGKKLSKTELKQFKEKRKAKKEEKRRAWLRD